jgi:hypothetical protein
MQGKLSRPFRRVQDLRVYVYLDVLLHADVVIHYSTYAFVQHAAILDSNMFT